jgi:hypothetical protein
MWMRASAPREMRATLATGPEGRGARHRVRVAPDGIVTAYYVSRPCDTAASLIIRLRLGGYNHGEYDKREGRAASAKHAKEGGRCNREGNVDRGERVSQAL